MSQEVYQLQQMRIVYIYAHTIVPATGMREWKKLILTHYTI